MASPPPVVSEESSCLSVVEKFTSTGASKVLIRDATGKIVGIVTERDVTWRIAFRFDPESNIADAMTSPVKTVKPSDMLYQAIGIMRQLDLRHMPVITNSHEVVGILHLRDALASASAVTVRQIDGLVHEQTLDGLWGVKSIQAEVAEQMLADGVVAADIQALISHVNRDIHRRIADRVLKEMKREGFGDSPVEFCVVVMGSGGRDENFLYPDQDNGLIIEDYPDSEHNTIDPYFIEFSKRFTNALDEIGFPLCRGWVMATNPVWRKTLSQWETQTTSWAASRSGRAVRFADIFFDYQPVWGNFDLADQLRDHITHLMQNNVSFLIEIAKDQRNFSPALKSFGRFRTEPKSRGRVNLKKGGLQILVNVVRIFSLHEGISATSTLERIAQLNENDTLNRNDAEEFEAAFRHIASLLLKSQVESFSKNQPIDNLVNVKTLTRLQKKRLKESLRLIRDIQGRALSDLSGNILES